jgi:hypothetical protein
MVLFGLSFPSQVGIRFCFVKTTLEKKTLARKKSLFVLFWSRQTMQKDQREEKNGFMFNLSRDWL